MDRASRWPSALAAVVLVGAASSSAAHHPPRFERCQRFTFTGQLEEIVWKNPHVLLTVRTEDGSVRQAGWLNTHQLKRAGIGPDTLRIGNRLHIEGGTRPKDASKEPILLSTVRRLDDGWEWSQPLQGC